jgi:hypothetical protein
MFGQCAHVQKPLVAVGHADSFCQIASIHLSGACKLRKNTFISREHLTPHARRGECSIAQPSTRRYCLGDPSSKGSVAILDSPHVGDTV